MVKVFYTSDTHFGHRFVAGLRGFDSFEDHDQYMIDRWNSFVSKNDVVFHLGDFSMRQNDYTKECAKALNGRIHLVAGNHDSCWHRHSSRGNIRRAVRSVGWFYDAGFEEVYTSGSIVSVLPKVGNVLLSHLPSSGDHGVKDRYGDRRPSSKGVIICGHVHSEWDVMGQNINVGVDVRDMKPVEQSELVKIAQGLRLPQASSSDACVSGRWNEFGLF